MKLKKKVSEIYNTPYGQNCVSCEPSKEEIERAVREQNPEKRGFQDDLSELIAEWEKVSRSEYYDHIRQYHARRIAFFVENKWHDPIALNKDEYTVKDGLHRLKAAIYSGIEIVDVEISGDPA